MPALALDIGTYSVKALSADPGENPVVRRAAEVFNPTGISVPTDDASTDKLATVIESVIADNNLPRTDVRLALPETIVSTKVISIPPLSDAELASAINWQAEQHIPIPPEELSLQYQVLYRPPKHENEPMRVLLIGTRKKLIERLVGMFNNMGIEPSLVETQMLAIIRSLQFEYTDPTTLVAHIGGSTMFMSIVHKAEPQFVVSHLNGGQLLSKALEQGVGLDSTQSEQYKRTYGLDEEQFQGKVRQALLPSVNIFLNEMRKAAQFFVSQHHQETVHRVVLSGGTAMLPGFVQYVAAELGVEVLVAAPFTKSSANIPETINHPSMAVCMGLLMRDV